MSKRLLIDSHAVLWWVLGNAKLSERARTAMQDRLDAGEALLVSSWSVAELLYATEKRPENEGHIPPSDLDEVVAFLKDEERGFEIAPVTMDVTVEMRSVPRAWTNDPWDRAIIATARAVDATLVTADQPHRDNPDIDTLW